VQLAVRIELRIATERGHHRARSPACGRRRAGSGGSARPPAADHCRPASAHAVPLDQPHAAYPLPICHPESPRSAHRCRPESARSAHPCHPERSEGSRRLDAPEIPRLRLGMTRSDRLGMTRRGGRGMAKRSRREVTMPHPESSRTAHRWRRECAGSAHRCHPERSEGSRRLDTLEIPRLRLGMTRSNRLGMTRGDLLGMTRSDRLGTTRIDRLGMTRSRRPGRNGSGRLAMAGGGRVGVMSTGLPRMTRAGGHSAVANRVASAHAAGRGRPQPPQTAAHGFRRTGA
jgi:hypothetical protein